MSREHAERSVIRRVVVARACDGCGKRIEGENTPEGWLSFSSSHSEWGNDSVETFELHDACSFPCFVKIARERYTYWEAVPSLTIDDKDVKFIESMLDAFPAVTEGEQ